VSVTYKKGTGLDGWIYWHFIHTHTTRDCRQYSATADLHTLQFTVTYWDSQTSLVVPWQWIRNSLSVTWNHTWSLLCTVWFLSYRYSATANSIQFLCWRLEIRLTLLNWSLLYNHFAGTTQKTLPLYCREDVFTEPLHRNGRYSIVAWVLVAAGMCLPSRCLAINFYTDMTIPAFGRNVTIYIYIYIYLLWHDARKPE
jgi:hypothetical protein